ncbi:tetratricopeptide repeat protein [Desulfococcaceae bacterium HSG8]|nr:tetratricopeptide repeat protein [Desulfococcaceae bacterium HSG8]
MNKADHNSGENGLAREVADKFFRAVTSDSSLFLLVYYEHEASKVSFLRDLRGLVLEQGFAAQTFDPVHRPEHGEGALYSELASASGKKSLCLIPDLPRAGSPGKLDETFLNYLNLHRDNILGDCLRMVLFIHNADAEQFIHSAGDLWDFRHGSCWLERKAGIRGAGLWQNIEEMSAELPLPQEDREGIANHVKQVRSLVDETAEPKEKARLLLDMTKWLHRRYAASLAVETALEGIGYIPQDRTELRGDLEYWLGYALDMSLNYPEALNHYEESLAIYREIGDRSGEGTTLNNISQIYRAWGRNEEALRTLEESLDIRREIGDRSGEGTTLNNISQIYRAWGRNEEALRALEESLAIRREIGDRSGEGTTLNNISQIYDSWGSYEEALRALEESLAIRREIGDRSGEGTTLNNISQIYDSWGSYEEALSVLEESLAIRREIGDRSGEGTTLNNISQIYDSWGRYEEALSVLEESLAICREIGDRSGEGTALNNISQIYDSWGRYEEALGVLEESLAIFREIGDRSREGGTLNNISQIYRAWGRNEEALRVLEESLAIRREIGDRSGEGAALNNISQIYHAWGRNEEALRVLEESLVISREIGDRSGESVTCWNLSMEWERRGDIEKALEFARCTVEIREQTAHPDFEQNKEYLGKLESRLRDNYKENV